MSTRSEMKSTLPTLNLSNSNEQGYTQFAFVFRNCMTLHGDEYEKICDTTVHESKLDSDVNKKVFAILASVCTTSATIDILQRLSSRSGREAWIALNAHFHKETDLDINRMFTTWLSTGIDEMSVPGLEVYKLQTYQIMRKIAETSDNIPSRWFRAVILSKLSTDDAGWLSFQLQEVPNKSESVEALFNKIESILQMKNSSRSHIEGGTVLTSALSSTPPARPQKILHNNKGEKTVFCAHCRKDGVNAQHASDKCFHQFPHLAPHGFKPRSQTKSALRSGTPATSFFTTNVPRTTPGAQYHTQDFSFMMKDDIVTLDRNALLLDSCSTRHIVNNLALPFVNKHTFRQFKKEEIHQMSCGGGPPMDAVGEVELLINSIDKNGVPTSISVRNALVIPDFRTNLLSEPQLMASAEARGVNLQYISRTGEEPHLILGTVVVPLQRSRTGGLPHVRYFLQD